MFQLSISKIKYLLFIIFFSISSHVSKANDLNILFFDLKNAKNETIAKKIETKIWQNWIRGGSSKKSNQKMLEGIDLLNYGNLDKAYVIFKNLSEIEPKWAETYNKLATIKYLQRDYRSSIYYINLTLKLEPRHFGAISGLAQINLSLDKFDEALKNINYVLKIHPYIGIKKLKPLLLKKLNKKET